MTSTLNSRIETLLAERESLKPLLARYQVFLSQKFFNDERTNLEDRIAAFIADGLHFNEEDRRKELPQARHLTECAFNLQTAFFKRPVLDNPELAWDSHYAHLVSGVSTDAWNPRLKERLLDLCGPLDGTLARMLSE